MSICSGDKRAELRQSLLPRATCSTEARHASSIPHANAARQETWKATGRLWPDPRAYTKRWPGKITWP